MRPGETPRAQIVADLGSARRWCALPEAMTSVEAGLEETVAWYRREWLPGWLARKVTPPSV